MDRSPNPFWIALLPVEARHAWHQGRLDTVARRLGISGWLVPQAVTSAGTFDDWLLSGAGDLPAAPLLQIKEPLTPKGEQQLVQQLRPWWRQSQALRLFGRPLVMLQGAEHLSHLLFSLKRLRWMASDLLLLSCDRGDVLERMEQGFDGQVLALGAGSKDQMQNYLQQLRSAHHGMEPRGLWIPAVQALTPATELGWREGSAEAYREWLSQATAWSRLRFLGEAEAPVLIARWQGHQRWWPDGSLTHLKAELVAEPAALVAEAPERRCWGTPQSEHVALMIHGYYLEKLVSILQRLPAGGHRSGIPGLDLYVSTPREQLDQAEALIRDLGWPRVHLVGVANRGRDIAPFLLELLPAALKQGHTAFVKLHTKSSPHLEKGGFWEKHMVDALLDFKLLGDLPERLQNDLSLGLLVPAGTLLPMSVALQANALHLQRLLQEQGWSGQWFLQQRFAAGSMMCGRLQALKLLLDLELSLECFESEDGQIDGTLAHALERWISLVIQAQKLRVDVLPGQAEAVPRFGYGWVGDVI